MREYMLKRYHKQREDAIAQLGGQCIDCGATEMLEFDHVDPADKSFSVGKGYSTTEERINTEFAKCVLRCRTCHIERTRKQKMSGKGCGQRGVWYCSCSECKAYRREHQREWRKNRSH